MVLDSSQLDRGKILIVDDDKQILDLLSYCLKKNGFQVETVDNIENMKYALMRYEFNAVLLDIYLGEESGFDGLSYLLSEFPLTKVIIMTGRDSVELAVKAMEKGALTFVAKSKGADYIVQVLKNKLPTSDSSQLDPIKCASLAEKTGLIGSSQSICEVLAKIEQLKEVNSTVLIIGDTGTGKELVAKALHSLSTKSNERYEAINCSAIPDNLLESELFGYKKGAFTDAKVDRQGLFQICSKGTLFLDEISEMPLHLQSKVLRVLQENEVRPLGSSTSVNINTRIIAATNKDLYQAKERGAFRDDLFYRLSVLMIHIPPLRERLEDIPVLTQYFIEMFNKQFNKSVNMPSRYIIERLKAYNWPGNVREFKNAIERGVVLSKDGNLKLEDVLPYGSANTTKATDNANSWPSFPLSLVEAKKTFEKNYITQLLMASDGNISEAARIAGKHRAEIYRLIDKYQIDQKKFRFNSTENNQSHL